MNAKCSCFLVGLILTAPSTEAGDRDATVERGRNAVQAVSSPLTGSVDSWNQIWKQWGFRSRPDDFEEQLWKRYGLISAPESAESLPVGLTEMDLYLGKQLGNNCLLCHAGTIAGRTVIGLGNASLDLQSLLDDLTAVDPMHISVPVRIGNGRGVIEASAGTIFLLQYRDAELNLQLVPRKLHFNDELYHDIPAWWHRKRKTTMFHTGSTHVSSVRANLSFLLAPINSGQHIKDQEGLFTDIREYIMTIEPPEYPFSIDHLLAREGEGLFVHHCAECHGTYGPEGEYPNRIVPLEEVGTDPELVNAYRANAADIDYYASSWLFTEVGPDGEPLHGLNGDGYQAPPLDGIWATAPYFHNASVPTVADVLNSKARPQVFTRSFETDASAYDQSHLGWKTDNVDPASLESLTDAERRRIYDTRHRGRSNAGHPFGDHLTNADRMKIIEYLKTL